MSVIAIQFLFAPVLRALADTIRIEWLNKSIKYFLNNSITLAIAVFSCYVVWKASGSLPGVEPILDITVLQVATYWLVFDFLLNYLRKKPVFKYYGDFSDPKNLSFIEKHVYSRLHWGILLLIKVVIFTLAVLIYN